jgi:hypothetical protein
MDLLANNIAILINISILFKMHKILIQIDKNLNLNYNVNLLAYMIVNNSNPSFIAKIKDQHVQN